MLLTFSPALGEQTVLKLAPSASERPATQSILFKATFDSRESLLTARADGIKVELWSDLPVEGRSYGEWGAAQFGPLEPETALPEDARIFSPEGAAQEDDPTQGRTLYIHLPLPPHTHIGARFSFTYRLVHPSGHVQWLGEYGRNGELAIEQGLPGVDLREGWNISSDGTYRTHAFPGERVLGQLTNPEAWVCWSWKSCSLPTFERASQGSEGLAMILSPRTYTREVNVPRPLVFVASHSTFLKITEHGKIVLHSSSPFARVSFSVLEHSAELLRGVAALCSGEVLAFDNDAAVITCRPVEAEFPIHLVVLPMADTIRDHLQVSLRLRALTEDASGLALCSPDMRVVVFLPGPIPEEGHLALVGSCGTELLVAPAQRVVGTHEWHAALLTPHKELAVESDKSVTAQTPPTPPPSPPRSSTPAPRTRDVRGPAAQHDAGTVSPQTPLAKRSRPLQSRRAPPSALIPYRSRPHLLRRYIHMVLNVVLWFWSVFVRAIAVRIVGESITQRISGLLGLALVKTAPPASPKILPGAELGDLPEEGSANPGMTRGGPVVKLVSSEEKTDEVPPSDTASSSSQYATDPSSRTLQDIKSPAHVALSATIPPSSEAPVVFLSGRSLPKVIRASMNGAAVSLRDPVKLNDGVQLNHCADVVEGGRFEIIFES